VRQTLFAPEIGYQILDVRSEYEVNSGKVPGAINVPLINVKSRWSSDTGERTFDQTPNADFLNMVRSLLFHLVVIHWLCIRSSPVSQLDSIAEGLAQAGG
jgi:hypothetical protein